MHCHAALPGIDLLLLHLGASVQLLEYDEVLVQLGPGWVQWLE